MKYVQPVILGNEHGVTFAGDYYLSNLMGEVLRHNPSEVVMIDKQFYYRNSLTDNAEAYCKVIICTPLHAALFAKG